MGEIIEHDDNENALPSVHVGENNLPVPLKVYQDVYHQVTGRTEQIRQRYSQNLLIDFSEVEQLHHKIKQLCDIHKIVASNEAISIFHDKDRKEQFTSFERFRLYNANASSPSVTVVLKYNFSIIPAGLDRPQEYVVTIRLISRIAILSKIESEAPPFVRGGIYGFMAGNTAEVTIEYADYVIARGFLEAIDDWIRGCKSEPDMGWAKFLQRWSHLLPKTIKLIAAAAIIFFALQAVPIFITNLTDPQLWARFIILFGGSFYLIINLAEITGSMIEDAIDSFTVISYLNLNKGDKKLIDDFNNRKNRVIFKFVLGCFLTILLGIISSKIAEII
ncbi:MAG: hypothetical protein K2Y09_11160 [Nitrosomonas sp.]|uniref:hypothetical protein n=1 Tax=Nitrosomonas sp. TaxID=42353 RepID=UPI001D491ED2|nr:hypothetical protein [Nitrosomonas sp.]MBX9895718.1 hypothetical protein [Nitrosomonas sp.]